MQKKVGSNSFSSNFLKRMAFSKIPLMETQKVAKVRPALSRVEFDVKDEKCIDYIREFHVKCQTIAE